MEVQEDNSFDSSKFISTLWRNIIDTEISIDSAYSDLKSTGDQLKNLLYLKSKESNLTEPEQESLSLIDLLLSSINTTQDRNAEAKQLFERREEYVKDKLVKFTKELLEKNLAYKETGTLMGKSLYKKDPQRTSSLQHVVEKAQLLSGDEARTVIEKYNELRNCVRKERQDTYQKHLDGENPLLYFFRRKGILNSSLVDIYDKLLLAFTEMQPSEYAMYYSTSYEIV